MSDFKDFSVKFTDATAIERLMKNTNMPSTPENINLVSQIILVNLRILEEYHEWTSSQK